MLPEDRLARLLDGNPRVGVAIHTIEGRRVSGRLKETLEPSGVILVDADNAAGIPTELAFVPHELAACASIDCRAC
jgi:hypothetical protein